MTAKTVLHNFIAGAAAEPADGRYADLIDPTTGEVFASAPVSGQADVDRAMHGRRDGVRAVAGHHAERAAAGAAASSPTRWRPAPTSWSPPSRRTPASRSG